MRIGSRLTVTAVIIAASALVFMIACDHEDPMTPTRALAGTGPSRASARALDISRCASSNTGFTTSFTNPWFLQGSGGRQLVLEGEEDGAHTRNEVTLLNVTRTINGVTTRALEEREFIDGTLTELTWNYVAQASDGSVCYYGEDVDVYEGGTITHEGAWCATGPNQPGILVPADPTPGMEFRNEVAPGIAEDEARIVGIGPVTVPVGTFNTTVRIREFNPLDGEKDYKVLAEGVGYIIDGPQALTQVNQTSGAPSQPTLTLLACGS